MSKATTFSPAAFRKVLDTELATYEPGSPEAHVMPKAVQGLIAETEQLQGKWVIFAETAYHAGARPAMFPHGAHYMSDKATPELNLLTEACAKALYTGSDLELVLAPKGAKLSSEQIERRTMLRQRVGKKRSLFLGHLIAVEAEQTGETGTGEQAKGGAGKPTGARQPKGGKVNKDTIVEWSFGQLRAVVDKIQTCKDAPQAALELKAALVDLIDDAKQ